MLATVMMVIDGLMARIILLGDLSWLMDGCWSQRCLVLVDYFVGKVLRDEVGGQGQIERQKGKLGLAKNPRVPPGTFAHF